MALIMPVFALVAMCSIQFTRSAHAPSAHLTGFVATAAAGVGVFLFAPIMYERLRLRPKRIPDAVVMLPTPRHRILLAKNLAFSPFVGAVAVVFLGLVGLLVRMTWGIFLAGVLQVPLAFLIFSLACNLVAMLTPYRLAVGTLQAKKPKPIVFLAIFITMLMLLPPTGATADPTRLATVVFVGGLDAVAAGGAASLLRIYGRYEPACMADSPI